VSVGLRVAVSVGLRVAVSVGLRVAVSVGLAVGVRVKVDASVGSSVRVGGAVARTFSVGTEVGASKVDVSCIGVAFVCGVGDNVLELPHAVKQQVASTMNVHLDNLYFCIYSTLLNPFSIRL